MMALRTSNSQLAHSTCLSTIAYHRYAHGTTIANFLTRDLSVRSLNIASIQGRFGLRELPVHRKSFAEPATWEEEDKKTEEKK
ncbi:hypothetical protein Vi05172_g12573 [Venturia inaequalis]|nr:hypothetical protein Vi05172_g12573 [Venturia inaequalis]